MTVPEKFRLLAIEDTPEHAHLLAQAFGAESDRFELTLVDTIEDAFAAIADTVPDLIITDLNLPDGRGTDLLELQLPLVVMTSQGDENTAVEAIKGGALDYIVKSAEAFRNMPYVAHRAISAWHNIVERRRAEAELRHSEERLAEAQRVARIGSWEWDLKRDRIWGTDESHRIFGLTDPRAIRTIEDLMAHVLDPDRDRMRRAFEAAADDDEPLNTSCRIARGDGTIRVVHITGQLVAGEGETRRVIGTVQDVTERKRLEEEFLQAQKLEAIGLLASGVAHDINNLLMGIRGCLDVALSRLPDGAPSRRYIGEARAATESGAAVTSQLLMFSRKREEQATHVAVDALIEDIRHMIGRLLGEGIQLELRLAAPGAHTICDPGRLQQAVMNLVVNARDAMQGGGTLTIATSLTSLAGEGFIQLSFSDTGCGMDDVTRHRVFEPFFTTKPIGQGTGLGLSTTYAIVTQAGGHIELTSEVGVGTTFRLLLPHAEDAPIALDTTDTGPARPATLETVLVVEDERLVRIAVRHYLEAEGYRVLLAESASQARLIARKHAGEIALLLTDVVLPDGIGPDVAREIAREIPGLPTICMSAYSADILESQYGFERGAPRLQKPFERAQLIAKVREVLETPSGRRRAQVAPTVLLGEDNPAARLAMQTLLEDLGYEVLSASTGAEARGQFAEHGRRIDVVLTDIGLPDATAGTLIGELRLRRPELGVVYISGRSRDDELVRALLAEPRTAYVQKPIDIEDVERAMEALMR